MVDSFKGNYPIERRAGELERLRAQAEAMAPDTLAMLDRFGEMDGWTCADVGCGPGGITELLSERVGPAGRVVGIDMDAEFLDIARAAAAANTDFHLGDAYATDLPAGMFDLVHMRFIASTAGDPERLIAEAIRIARPGGIVALQEPDGSTLTCHPPHPAWDQLKGAFLGAFRGAGANLELGRELYAVVCGSGLRDVQYRTALLGVRSSDPMVDYLPATVESLRGTIVKLGLLSESALESSLCECRLHLAKPETSFTMYTVAQVWGLTPETVLS